MAETIFEHLKYQLYQNLDHFLKILVVKQVVSKIYRCSQYWDWDMIFFKKVSEIQKINFKIKKKFNLNLYLKFKINEN
jgi:hypothetical protein